MKNELLIIRCSKLILLIICIVFCFSSCGAGDGNPSWNSMKKDFEENYTDFLEKDVTKVEKIDDVELSEMQIYDDESGSYIIVTKLNQPAWLYYNGELSGEVRRQKLFASYENIKNIWQFKGLRISMVEGNEEVSPPDELPPVPSAPDENILKQLYMDEMSEEYRIRSDLEFIGFEYVYFNIINGPDYISDKKYGYGIVEYLFEVEVSYSILVEYRGAEEAVEKECSHSIILRTEKRPAAEWFESTDVDEWIVNIDAEELIKCDITM